jgi:ubiquitin-activating enzyme E1
LKRQLEINALTHSKNIRFIAADVRGLFASVFCDFGEEFMVNDTTGEQALSGMVASVTKVELT